VLQICLSIQVLGLDEADVFGRRRAQQEQVCWEKLILVYFDNLASFDLLPSDLRYDWLLNELLFYFLFLDARVFLEE